MIPASCSQLSRRTAGRSPTRTLNTTFPDTTRSTSTRYTHAAHATRMRMPRLSLTPPASPHHRRCARRHSRSLCSRNRSAAVSRPPWSCRHCLEKFSDNTDRPHDSPHLVRNSPRPCSNEESWCSHKSPFFNAEVVVLITRDLDRIFSDGPNFPTVRTNQTPLLPSNKSRQNPSCPRPPLHVPSYPNRPHPHAP